MDKTGRSHPVLHLKKQFIASRENGFRLGRDHPGFRRAIGHHDARHLDARHRDDFHRHPVGPVDAELRCS